MLRSALSIAATILLSLTSSLAAEDLTAGLTLDQLEEIRGSVDRGLQFISQHQNDDGSFSRQSGPAPVTTSYVVVAFLSRGHQPGQGRYGRQMRRAIDWLLSEQRPDGSLSQYRWAHGRIALTLCEVYGSAPSDQAERIGEAVRQALVYSRTMQTRPKLDPAYEGGWSNRPIVDGQAEASNLETTAWTLVFMRSAINAGFKVPQVWIDEGLEFVERCYKPGPDVEGDRGLPVGPHQAVFNFYPKRPPGRRHWANFSTTANGMLALQVHGRRNDPMIEKTSDWLVSHPVPRQGTIGSFYYTCYTTSHAMAQVGGRRWETYFSRAAKLLLSYQDPAGHFRVDRSVPWKDEASNGLAHHTALACVCLSLPDQLLPIHQR